MKTLLPSRNKNKTSSKYLGVTKNANGHYVKISTDMKSGIACTYNVTTESVPDRFKETASAIAATYFLSDNKKQGEMIGKDIKGLQIEVPEEFRKSVGGSKYIRISTKKVGKKKVRTMSLSSRSLKTLLPVELPDDNVLQFEPMKKQEEFDFDSSVVIPVLPAEAITIRIPTEWYKKAKSVCDDLDITMSGYISSLIAYDLSS